MRFCTDVRYSNRETKAKYVWNKYSSILIGKILDVGSDACFLRGWLPPDAVYTGIGLGGSPDVLVNLEKAAVPFDANSFDCVLCLDVLEHLENIHQVFDELCRVSKGYVIISMPNAWSDMYDVLRHQEYRPGMPFKYYGLPLEPVPDRHKWFCSFEEVERFICHRSAKNEMEVLQIDAYKIKDETGRYGRYLRYLARTILFRGDLNFRNLYAQTLWAVIRKRDVPAVAKASGEKR